MCLIDKKLFRFTFKRIPIYKVVQVLPDRTYTTPCIGSSVKKHMHGNYLDFPKKYKYYPVSEYSAGFIHAFETKIEAEFFIGKLIDDIHLHGRICTTPFKIIEGYIPAFTRIGKGFRSYNFPEIYVLNERHTSEICARRMVFNI